MPNLPEPLTIPPSEIPSGGRSFKPFPHIKPQALIVLFMFLITPLVLFMLYRRQIFFNRAASLEEYTYEFTTPARVNAEVANAQIYPDLAIGEQRHFVTWRDHSVSGSDEAADIMVATSDGLVAGDSWGGYTQLTQASITASDDYYPVPSIAAANDDQAIVVWDGSSELYFSRTSNGGDEWTSPAIIQEKPPAITAISVEAKVSGQCFSSNCPRIALFVNGEHIITTDSKNYGEFVIIDSSVAQKYTFNLPSSVEITEADEVSIRVYNVEGLRTAYFRAVSINDQPEAKPGILDRGLLEDGSSFDGVDYAEITGSNWVTVSADEGAEGMLRFNHTSAGLLGNQAEFTFFNSGSEGFAHSPKIIYANGTYYVVAVILNDSEMKLVMYHSLDQGDSWSFEEVEAGLTGTDWQSVTPAIAYGGGKLHIVYAASDEIKYALREVASGSSWSTPQTIAPSFVSNPRLIANDDKVFVAFAGGEASVISIATKNHSDSNFNFYQVGTGENTHHPDLALSGDLLQVYWVSGNDLSYSGSRDEGVTWLAPIMVTTGGGNQYPAVAAGANTPGSVVYQGSASGDFDIYASSVVIEEVVNACGDGVCEAPEDSTSCPEDCPPSTTSPDLVVSGISYYASEGDALAGTNPLSEDALSNYLGQDIYFKAALQNVGSVILQKFYVDWREGSPGDVYEEMSSFKMEEHSYPENERLSNLLPGEISSHGSTVGRWTVPGAGSYAVGFRADVEHEPDLNPQAIGSLEEDDEDNNEFVLTFQISGSSCGDGVCTPPEDGSNCPEDCGITPVPRNGNIVVVAKGIASSSGVMPKIKVAADGSFLKVTDGGDETEVEVTSEYQSYYFAITTSREKIDVLFANSDINLAIADVADKAILLIDRVSMYTPFLQETRIEVENGMGSASEAIILDTGGSFAQEFSSLTTRHFIQATDLVCSADNLLGGVTPCESNALTISETGALRINYDSSVQCLQDNNPSLPLLAPRSYCMFMFDTPGDTAADCVGKAIGALCGEVVVVPTCGDGVCTPPEDSTTCPQDCPAGGLTCGDGVCEPPEDEINCPPDCAVALCRDETAECGAGACCPGLVEVGFCELGSDGLCVCMDCGSVCRACGNGVCEANENECMCPQDCAVGTPDLEVSGITYYASEADAITGTTPLTEADLINYLGQQIYFKAELTNIGDGQVPVGFFTEWRQGTPDEDIAEMTVLDHSYHTYPVGPILPPGTVSEHESTIQNWTVVAGTHKIGFIADSENFPGSTQGGYISEVNENNNAYTITLQISDLIPIPEDAHCVGSACVVGAGVKPCVADSDCTDYCGAMDITKTLMGPDEPVIITQPIFYYWNGGYCEEFDPYQYLCEGSDCGEMFRSGDRLMSNTPKQALLDCQAAFAHCPQQEPEVCNADLCVKAQAEIDHFELADGLEINNQPPMFRLWVNGTALTEVGGVRLPVQQVVANEGAWQIYTFDVPGLQPDSSVYIAYVNDRFDTPEHNRNLLIDWVEIAGNRIQAENAQYDIGEFVGHAEVFRGHQSSGMDCKRVITGREVMEVEGMLRFNSPCYTPGSLPLGTITGRLYEGASFAGDQLSDPGFELTASSAYTLRLDPSAGTTAIFDFSAYTPSGYTLADTWQGLHDLDLMYVGEGEVRYRVCEEGGSCTGLLEASSFADHNVITIEIPETGLGTTPLLTIDWYIGEVTEAQGDCDICELNPSRSYTIADGLVAVLNQAGAAYQVPAEVLLGILLHEGWHSSGPHVLDFTQEQVSQAVTSREPYCFRNSYCAAGPFQFSTNPSSFVGTVTELSNGCPDWPGYDLWSITTGTAGSDTRLEFNQVLGETADYTPHPCNLRDAAFAAAAYVKEHFNAVPNNCTAWGEAAYDEAWRIWHGTCYDICDNNFEFLTEVCLE